MRAILKKLIVYIRFPIKELLINAKNPWMWGGEWFYTQYPYLIPNNNDTIITHSQDSLIIKDEIKKLDISFNIINFEINGEQKILVENLLNPTNIILDERDTLSIIIQLKGNEEEIIFNYYFNDNPNYRNIEPSYK